MKCPNCGAPVEDTSSGKCEYCGLKLSSEEIKVVNETKQKNDANEPDTKSKFLIVLFVILKVIGAIVVTYFSIYIILFLIVFGGCMLMLGGK